MPIHPFFRVNPTTIAAPSFVNPWSGFRDGTGLGGTTANYGFYNARAISVVAGTIARATVPGASGIRIQAIDGDASGTGEQGTVTGSNLDLGAALTSVNSAIGGTWPASTGAGLTFANCIGFSSIADGSTSDDNNIALLYEDAADSSINYYGFGNRLTNLLSGAGTSARYTTFGVADAVATTESFVQTPWPSTGTFQYVTILYSVGTGTGPVTAVLNIAGVASSITFSLADSGGVAAFTSNAVLTASVNAGDLVSWRLQNAAGTASFSCALLCGFVRS